jgi:putative transcription factor
MHHQDWEPVILQKKQSKTLTNNDMRNGKFQVRTKKSESAQKMNKIDNETEKFTIKKISKKVSQEIQKGRLAKKLTQKQLANAINVSPKVITEMESGKAQPNEAVKRKIARVLNITF